MLGNAGRLILSGCKQANYWHPVETKFKQPIYDHTHISSKKSLYMSPEQMSFIEITFDGDMEVLILKR